MVCAAWATNHSDDAVVIEIVTALVYITQLDYFYTFAFKQVLKSPSRNKFKAAVPHCQMCHLHTQRNQIPALTVLTCPHLAFHLYKQYAIRTMTC